MEYVLIIHELEDYPAWKKVFESPGLVNIRKQAGVKAPEFVYLEQLEKGVL